MLATIVGSGDVVVGISDSGRSTVINEAMRQARLHGAATIGITSTEGTPFVEYSDVSLFTSTLPSGGALYGESVTSKWGQTLVIDVLYAAFAAQHYDRTLAHLEETYTAAIEHSRS
jgi:DNA-binding MurR/RpiR family transcriptional regulator